MKKALILVAMALVLAACYEMDDVYKEFISDGPAKYVGKAENVQVFPGFGRVKIVWSPFIDNRVSSATIYWDNRTCSQENAIDPSKPTEIYVDNLSEGPHIFEIITHSAAGNNSVPVSVSCNVYGESFMSITDESDIISAVLDYKGEVQLRIRHSSSYYYKMLEMVYLGIDGSRKKVFAYPGELGIVLDDCGTSDISYRSVFLPDDVCIDSLYSHIKTIKPEGVALEIETELDETMMSFIKGDTVSFAAGTNFEEVGLEYSLDASGCEWLSLEYINGRFFLKTTAVNLGARRSATLTLTANELSKVVSIYQEAKDPRLGTLYGSEGVVFHQNSDSSYKIISGAFEMLPWSVSATLTGASGQDGSTGGESNIDIIKRMPDYGNGNTYAVSFCEAMGEGWYLPSLKELRDEFFPGYNGTTFDEATEAKYTAITSEEQACRDVYNASISSISAQPFCDRTNGLYYWTCCEVDKNDAFYVRLGYKKTGGISKTGSNIVRCVKKVNIE